MAQAKTTSSVHTAGPWHYERYEKAANSVRGVIFQKTETGTSEIAQIVETDCGTNEADANAHLIAASPVMLEALLFVAPYLRDHVQYDNGEKSGEAEALEKITEAIAAATRA